MAQEFLSPGCQIRKQPFLLALRGKGRSPPAKLLHYHIDKTPKRDRTDCSMSIPLASSDSPNLLILWPSFMLSAKKGGPEGNRREIGGGPYPYSKLVVPKCTFSPRRIDPIGPLQCRHVSSLVIRSTLATRELAFCFDSGGCCLTRPRLAKA
jgi:hypothetical protein